MNIILLSNAHSTLPQQLTQQWPGDPTFLHWWFAGQPTIFAYFNHTLSYTGTCDTAVFTKIIGHVGHFRWLSPNVWWEISQIWIEYIKPIGQMSDEPWKFFMNTVQYHLQIDSRLIILEWSAQRFKFEKSVALWLCGVLQTEKIVLNISLVFV